ncbi:MAG: GH92 family glycosyl hydrolase [Pseudobacter sp.]|uniref:GH92 family glycosyl hydrolase n=1 Tax=Pseudobacter sp. TaxID=2045420 RepID=UPI003F7F6A3C
MKKIFFATVLYCGCFLTDAHAQDYARYVNPFIGNADNGHTFPGACAPFGMIQASPESGNGSWRYCSGFNADDSTINGFAQNHLNGTGCPDLGDILLFPFSEENRNPGFISLIDKRSQEASPGYYKVNMTGAGVRAEVTATERTAFYQFNYYGSGSPLLLLDMQSGLVTAPDHIHNRVLYANMEMPDSQTITGGNEVRVWVKRKFFYVIEFNSPYTVKEALTAVNGEKAKRLILQFDLKKGQALQVKLSISTVSVDGARASLEKENPGWDFQQIRKQTRANWNRIFQRASIKGTDAQKTNFYTSIYHLCIQPNNIADVDGRYRGADDQVYTSPSGDYYSTFSLWDTYRAAHPLYTILVPERVNGMISSMIAHHNVNGYLPIWTLWGKENHCMIGNHAIPVIADAVLKGFGGFDKEAAYRAVKESATKNHTNTDWEVFDRYGYFPFDIIKAESVSKTLEATYDNYCAAQMAKALGKEEDHVFFMKRAGYFYNLYDTATGFMRGRDSAGNWRIPFEPLRLFHAGAEGGDYTEGNAWQYSWSVQHDAEALVKLAGGKNKLADKLDSLFVLKAGEDETGHVHDVSGLIGQYAHGNEPSHHIIYLYNYADKHWRAQELLRHVVDSFYLPKPDGLCGNDDCGQMSAWYLFTSMGFYPLNPCGGQYETGAPQLKAIRLKLPGSKRFKVKAKHISPSAKYVRSIRLNGSSLNGTGIHHNQIMKGGKLVFYMSAVH